MMTILRYLFSKHSIKRKIYDIQNDIINIVKPSCPEKFDVIWYGAYQIDPKNLVYWICVESDEIKDQLAKNISLNEELRSLLIKNNYPEQARRHVYIGFESQETVDRESNGSWYVHFK
jgi:hypothetical protein